MTDDYSEETVLHNEGILKMSRKSVGDRVDFSGITYQFFVISGRREEKRIKDAEKGRTGKKC